MKGLRIIPILVILMVLVYLGVGFVEANQENVILTIGSHVTEPTRLGFVVMTSVLLGIILGAALASAQVFLLFFQNRSLRKQISRTDVTAETRAAAFPSDSSRPHSDDDFNP